MLARPTLRDPDNCCVNATVIARSPCDEAIQGPRAAAPGLLTWGFSRQWLISVFHVVGFLMWRGRGLDGQRSAVEIMEARFSGGSGLSRGEARRRRRAWRALDGPEPPEVLRT